MESNQDNNSLKETIPQKRTKVFFASDFHLGAPNHKESRQREDKIIRWLTSIENEAKAIYLLGDLFDFWHEYKTVVPKGFVRFLGKIAQLKDSGIDVQIFIGNHDLWVRDYFETEFNIPVYHEAQVRKFSNKLFLVGHGDGLGPGDFTYKKLKKVFKNPLSRWLFRWLHPDIGMKLAQLWSSRSRGSHSEPEVFHGEEKEYLLQFCKEVLQEKHYDYFIFGHRHLPIDFQLNEHSRYINLGEWISQYNYAVFNGENLELLTYEE